MRDVDWTSIAASLAAGVVAIAGSYALAASSFAFVAVPVTSFVFETMPAPIVAFSILVLGKWGTVLGFTLALALTTGGMGAIVFASIAAERRLGIRFAAPVLTTAGGWFVASLLTSAPLSALGAAIPMGVFVAIFEIVGGLPSEERTLNLSRRDLLASVSGILGFSGLAFVFGNRRSQTPDRSGNKAENNRSNQSIDRYAQTLLKSAESNSLDVDGLPGLVSDDKFYEVDINIVNPTLDRANWKLTVTGDVEEETMVTYSELTKFPAEREFVTLRCVSDSLNGELMDNALWTVVPIMQFIKQAGPQGKRVMLRSEDGYFEGFPLECLEQGVLAYEMNGRPLPRKHGYPVRALIRGHFGEINVKWITEIEVLDEKVEGYWERRGWHGTGPVTTVAKLRTVNRLDDGRIQVAGHAYAGIKGIQQVEVSVNGGQSWNDATLSKPLKDEDVWRQWKWEWTPTRKRHKVVVRAIDGEGTVQASQRSGPRPDGATGWVSEIIEADNTALTL